MGSYNSNDYLKLIIDEKLIFLFTLRYSGYSTYKSILIKLILIMDKIVESRMNRSLIIHGLENLVFEKRQRKTL